MGNIFEQLAAVTGNEELDLVDNTVVEATPEEVAEIVADKVIAETQEQVSEVAEQVADLAEAIEDVQETMEDIEETVDGLESLLSGNFNSTAAASAYNRLQRLVAKVGGNVEGSRVGAESLTDASTAQMMMREGMEAAEKEGEGWFKRAGNFLKALWEKLVAFVVGLFDASAGYRRKVAILEKALDDGDVATKIKVGEWNRYIDAKNFKSASKSALEAGIGIGSVFNRINDMVEKSALYGSNVAEFAKAYQGIVSELKKVQFGSGNSVSKGGVDRAIINQYGVRIVMQFATVSGIKDLKDIAKACRALRMSVVANPDSKVETSGEVDVAVTKAELKNMLKYVIEVCKHLEGAKSLKNFKVAAAERLIAELRSEMDKKDDKADAKAVFNNITALTAMSNRVMADQNKITMKSVDASLKFVKACITTKTK